MSDWREGDSSRKKEKPKRDSLPVIPRREEPNPSQEKSKSWTGKPNARQKGSTEPTRSWTREAASSSPMQGMSWRKLLLWLLTPAVAIAAIAFFYFISKRKDNEIPLLMLVAKSSEPSELGVIALPHSAEMLGSVTKVLSPRANLLKSMRDDLDNSEDWLRNLEDDSEMKEYLKPNTSNPSRLEGGGPANKFIAFYVNCFVVRQNQELVLVCDSDDEMFPLLCDSGHALKKPLLLKAALKHFAKVTPESCIAVVGLDVRLPSPVHNLGDIGFPADAFQEAFDSLGEKEKRKLVLFLPCDQGQESWVLPKSGMSVFGASFLEGLTALFGNKDLSLESFEEGLQRIISEWVSQNRKSRQEVRRIVADDTWKRIRNEQFLGLFGARPKTIKRGGVDSPNFNALYKELDNLWKRYEGIAKDRLDPDKHLALASLESHLLLLEDMIEYKPMHWGKMLDSAEEILRQVQPSQHYYNVSWIEDQKREDEAKEDPRYLENQIRHILLEDIDPDTRNDKSKNDLALDTLSALIERWGEIQRLACHPRRELSWWMNKQIESLDENFLKAVDEFSANNFDKSKALLLEARASLDSARSYQDRIRQCMEFRDEASSLLPHALAFLSRMSNFPESVLEDAKRKELKEQAKRLAGIAIDLDRVDGLLSDPNTNQPERVEVSVDSRMQLNAVKQWIVSEKVKDWLGDEKGDAETIRNLRTTVRYPFLPTNLREEIHKRLAQRFEEEDTVRNTYAQGEKKPGIETTEDVPSSNDIVVKSFLEQLEASGASSNEQEYWKIILSGDLRNSKFWRVDLEKPNTYRELYQRARQTRRILGALGTHTVSHSNHLNQSCEQQILSAYAAQNELRYRRMQRERLLLARWGSPDMDISRIDGDFLFDEFAKKYTDNADEQKKRILPDWDFDASQEKDLSNFFKSASDRLKTMPNWLDAKIEGESKILFQWTPIPEGSQPDLWERIQPSVKIATNTVQRNSPIVSFSRQTNRLLDNPTKQDFSAGNVDVTIAFRGHRIRSRATSDQVLFAGDWQPKLQSQITATIRNEKRSVVILLDCSGSMGYSDRMKNAEQALMSLVNIFRKSVSVGQEIEVSLVILGVLSNEPELAEYGFQPGIIGKKELGYVLSDSVPKYSHVAYTGFDSIKADESTARRWEKLLNAPFVAPGLNTPLYDSMELACELLKGRSSGTRDIVILSDGGNYVAPGFQPEKAIVDSREANPYYLKSLINLPKNVQGSPFSYTGPNQNALGAISQVMNSGIDLYFYQVIDDQPELDDDKEEVSKLKKMIAKERATFSEGLKELREKKLLKTPMETYADFLQIKQRIERDFALPEIKVHYQDPSNGPDLTLSFLEQVPKSIRPASVTLRAVRNEIEELSKKPIELEAYEGQLVQVEFDVKERELSFKPSKLLKEDNRFDAALHAKLDRSDSNPFAKYTMKWGIQRNESLRNAFNLRVDLRREQDRKPPDYLMWPKFAVGKLTRNPPGGESNPTANTILLSDLDFEKKHYPTLEFHIENLKDKAWDTSASLDLWWSFSHEKDLFGTREDIRKEVKNENSSEEFQGYRITRSGASIRVERDFRQGQEPFRWVLCPDAQRARREYRGRADRANRWTEVHTFDLADKDENQGVDVYFLSEEDLSKMAEDSATSKSSVYWYTNTPPSQPQ